MAIPPSVQLDRKARIKRLHQQDDMQNKKILRIFIVTTAILLIPLIAMQFSSEVVWDITDFVIAATLISGTGILYEFAAKRSKSHSKASNPTPVDWFFGGTFTIVGILNIVLVHPTPGILYLILSFLYFPPAYTALRKKFDLSIPLMIKVIIGFLVLWGTLAVGDLAEMFSL